MRNSASVAYNIQSLVLGLQIFVRLHFHIVELDFDAVSEPEVKR